MGGLAYGADKAIGAVKNVIKGSSSSPKPGHITEMATKDLNPSSGNESSAATRKYWKTSKEINGNKVYQRDDLIDPGKVSTWKENGKEVIGTNIERMESGRAPIGSDGKTINLHHLTQKQDGAIAEVTQTFHQKNYSTIHMNTGELPSAINRSEFASWRKEYWNARAADFK